MTKSSNNRKFKRSMPKSKELVTHVYPKVGRCIYCPSTENLGDEHVIPASLRGGMILPEASCRSCEKIINAYERVVGRRIFGHFRVKLGFKPRNSRERSKYLTTPIKIGTLSPEGVKGTAELMPLDHPIMLFTPKFDTATFLKGLPETTEEFRWTLASWASNTELDALKKSHSWDGVVQVVPYPKEMARTIAKIAYSYAIGELGPGTFTPLPMLLKTIRCETENVSYCVGGEWELPTPDPAGKHIIRITVMNNAIGPLLVVHVWLFPAFGLPKYHVVVGYFDIHEPQQIATLSRKMETAKPIFG